MADRPKTLLICSCEDTMRLDTAACEARIAATAKSANLRQLCQAELNLFFAMRQWLRVAHRCTPGGLAVRRRGGSGRAGQTEFVSHPRDGRLVGGWSQPGGTENGGTARSRLRTRAFAIPLVTLSSEGAILIYGRDESGGRSRQTARRPPRCHGDDYDAAADHSAGDDIDSLSSGDHPQRQRAIWVAFELAIDDYAPPRPSSRDTLAFEARATG
mgnify:CR=1 FL=1